MKKSEIKLTVTLDQNNFPEVIQWEAPGSGTEGIKPCKAVMISLWDAAESGTLRIELWTKQMMVDEMQRFFYETFISMADTYERATAEKDISIDIREFANHFGKKTKVLK